MQYTAREAALEALVRCRRDEAWSGATIDNVINKYKLDKRDAALAARISLGVLQNSSLCDFYIDCFCKSKLEPKLRDILRMGVYQILFLDRIPARAAVNESVILCKKQGNSKASGLVNAVLRKIADNKDRLPEIPGIGSAKHLALKYSHPEWLVQYVIEQKGYDFAEAFLAANNKDPGLDIQVNRLKVSAAEYAEMLNQQGIVYMSSEPDGCILLEGGNASELPGFEEGLFYVQDKAARLAAEIAGAKPGMKVLDCCSSPGGKSFASAILMRNEGSLLSCDIHEKKLRLVRSGAERLGIDIIETEAMDARSFKPEFENAFDLVIADVPCSGLGVIAKKPEIRNKDWDNLKALPVIQRDILNNVSRYVAPGGTLLYSTCTVLKEENEDVLTLFLEDNKNFVLEAFSICGINAEKGMYTFWPNVDGTDGFFAARLRRIS